MSDAFVAEIRMFPFNFAPNGWATCDGQLLPISQNTALFSLLGTTYGGNGKSNFALPDLQGATPMQPGQGQGLSLHDLGEMGGSETVTLLESEMPVHTHFVLGAGGRNNANNFLPDPTVTLSTAVNAQAYKTGSPAPVQTTMAPTAIAPSGGSGPHNNLQPYLTVNFCIAMQGIFPPRQ